MSVSSFSLLVLLYLSYVNLFKELFLNALHWTFLLLLCLRFRSFSKADAKVWLFSVSPKLLSKKVKKICTFRAEIDIPQLKAVFDNSNTLIIYSWEFRIGSWEFRGWERKFLIPNSDALPSDTIFAFLMLNTMSSAHDKIFGAKFSSFERFELMRLRTVGYAILWRSVMKSDSQKSRFLMQ